MYKINDWNLLINEEFLDMIKQKYNNSNIAPNYEDIFKVFKNVKFEDANVIILGQDPYPKEGDANGIAFSVDRKDKLPASLRNIYKELESDLGVKRENGDLTDIVKQGVLLLNTVLTVEVGKPKSHSHLGWNNITNDVIRQLDEAGNKIFVLLGNDAQKYEKQINNKTNFILKTSHPSPLAAYRGFLGSNIFTQVNQKLIQLGKVPLNWEENYK